MGYYSILLWLALKLHKIQNSFLPSGSGSGASVFGVLIGHSLDNRSLSWERGISSV